MKNNYKYLLLTSLFFSCINFANAKVHDDSCEEYKHSSNDIKKESKRSKSKKRINAKDAAGSKSKEAKGAVVENSANVKLQDSIDNFNTKSYAETRENLRSFVQNLIDFAINTINGPESDEVKKAKVHDVLNHSLDIAGISRFVLGKFNHKLTSEQKQDFQDLFKEYLLGFYGNIVKLYNGQTGSISKMSFDPDQSLYLVTVDIVNKDGNKMPVQYRIKYDKKFLVLDAVSQNVSFANTLKSQFTSILSQDNGFDKLKDFLRVSDPEKLKK